jgi:glycosyltransferase involved in cell wall biosynthesis
MTQSNGSTAVVSERNGTPVVSVGLAVRNDPDRVRHCIESVLSQDLADLELVISDNASDDGTVDVLQAYARADPRVSVTVNPVNIGSHENMNRVLLSSRGTLFRWISADDWLEPGALSAAVRALERHPEAIGATSGFTLHSPSGAQRREDYQGEFPTSADAGRRFERMLWFFHAGEAKYDPIYGTYRRERLMQTGRLRPTERTDWLLCAELALMGPIVHVDEQLANRTWSLPTAGARSAFRRRLDPTHGKRFRATPTRLYQDLHALTRSADLTEPQRRRCDRALRRFWAREAIRKTRLRLSDAVHQTRAKLSRLER